VLCGQLLAEHSGPFLRQDLGLRLGHAGRGQSLDEGAGVEDALAMGPI
jgi:hypothetical protein